VLYKGEARLISPSNKLTGISFTGHEVGETVNGLMNLPPSRELELPEKAGGPARRLKQKLGIE
jgi:hypothetical protein